MEAPGSQQCCGRTRFNGDLPRRVAHPSTPSPWSASHRCNNSDIYVTAVSGPDRRRGVETTPRASAASHRRAGQNSVSGGPRKAPLVPRPASKLVNKRWIIIDQTSENCCDTTMSRFLKRVSLARNEIENFAVYPFSLPLVRAMDTVELNPRVTFFVGANGSGKSTLLEAMAVALGFNAEGGSRNFNFTTRPSHSNLHDYLRLARGTCKPRTGIFCVQRASSTSQPRSTSLAARSSTQPMVAAHYTSNRTASHF